MVRFKTVNAPDARVEIATPRTQVLLANRDSSPIDQYHKARQLSEDGFRSRGLSVALECANNPLTPPLVVHMSLILASELQDSSIEAAESLVRALAIDCTRDISLWLQLGDLATQAQNWGLARCAYSRRLDLGGWSWPAADRLLDILIAIGDSGACMALANEALSRNPAYPKGQCLVRGEVPSSGLKRKLGDISSIVDVAAIECLGTWESLVGMVATRIRERDTGPINITLVESILVDEDEEEDEYEEGEDDDDDDDDDEAGEAGSACTPQRLLEFHKGVVEFVNNFCIEGFTLTPEEAPLVEITYTENISAFVSSVSTTLGVFHALRSLWCALSEIPALLFNPCSSRMIDNMLYLEDHARPDTLHGILLQSELQMRHIGKLFHRAESTAPSKSIEKYSTRAQVLLASLDTPRLNAVPRDPVFLVRFYWIKGRIALCSRLYSSISDTRQMNKAHTFLTSTLELLQDDSVELYSPIKRVDVLNSLQLLDAITCLASDMNEDKLRRVFENQSTWRWATELLEDDVVKLTQLYDSISGARPCLAHIRALEYSLGTDGSLTNVVAIVSTLVDELSQSDTLSQLDTFEYDLLNQLIEQVISRFIGVIHEEPDALTVVSECIYMIVLLQLTNSSDTADIIALFTDAHHLLGAMGVCRLRNGLFLKNYFDFVWEARSSTGKVEDAVRVLECFCGLYLVPSDAQVHEFSLVEVAPDEEKLEFSMMFAGFGLDELDEFYRSVDMFIKQLAPEDLESSEGDYLAFLQEFSSLVIPQLHDMDYAYINSTCCSRAPIVALQSECWRNHVDLDASTELRSVVAECPFISERLLKNYIFVCGRTLGITFSELPPPLLSLQYSQCSGSKLTTPTLENGIDMDVIEHLCRMEVDINPKRVSSWIRLAWVRLQEFNILSLSNDAIISTIENIDTKAKLRFTKKQPMFHCSPVSLDHSSKFLERLRSLFAPVADACKYYALALQLIPDNEILTRVNIYEVLAWLNYRMLSIHVAVSTPGKAALSPVIRQHLNGLLVFDDIFEACESYLYQLRTLAPMQSLYSLVTGLFLKLAGKPAELYMPMFIDACRMDPDNPDILFYLNNERFLHPEVSNTGVFMERSFPELPVSTEEDDSTSTDDTTLHVELCDPVYENIANAMLYSMRWDSLCFQAPMRLGYLLYHWSVDGVDYTSVTREIVESLDGYLSASKTSGNLFENDFKPNTSTSYLVDKAKLRGLVSTESQAFSTRDDCLLVYLLLLLSLKEYDELDRAYITYVKPMLRSRRSKGDIPESLTLYAGVLCYLLLCSNASSDPVDPEDDVVRVAYKRSLEVFLELASNYSFTLAQLVLLPHWANTPHELTDELDLSHNQHKLEDAVRWFKTRKEGRMMRSKSTSTHFPVSEYDPIFHLRHMFHELTSLQ